MLKDYYEVLGIAKSASTDEIKRAYRKAAHQHHPDKGGDSEKFKEINEAYQILSDENKRAAYDRFGHTGVNNGGPGQGFGGFSGQSRSTTGWEDIFSGQTGGFRFDFGSDGAPFGGSGGLGDIFGDLFEGAFSTVQAEIEIPLTTALLGGEIQVTSPTGDRLELKIPEGTKNGTTFAVRGKGNQTRRGRGDLHLTVKIRFPRRLSREQKRLIDELRLTGL